MPDLLPVKLIFQGAAFDKTAVLHTLRHVAMRAGWVFSPDAHHRLIYATFDNPHEVVAQANDLVVLSSPSVGCHLANSRTPIPMTFVRDAWMPFLHPHSDECQHPGWIPADVIAGAYAVQNLWFEQRIRPLEKDGWIEYQDDWWAKSGFDDPFPVVDDWYSHIQAAAQQLGWTRTTIQEQGSFVAHKPFILLLTHDVDYLPSGWNMGFPRLVRALARQLLTRKSVRDAWRIFVNYLQSFFSGKTPYFDLPILQSVEGSRGVRSSFQMVVAHHHRADPSYDLGDEHILSALRQMQTTGWEICLHGSYAASRSAGWLSAERKKLEDTLGGVIQGHRQHYLNFHPAQIFSEAENAGLLYDLSVGYNNRSGPRAGTMYPYVPYNIEKHQPYRIWEIPFVIMDTTLATTYCLQSADILEHVQSVLSRKQGCVAVVWHQEQAGGLLDPGFDTAYAHMLDWAIQQDAYLTSPASLLDDLNQAWSRTLGCNELEFLNGKNTDTSFPN